MTSSLQPEGVKTSRLAIIAPLDDELKTLRTRMTVDERIFRRPTVMTRGRLGAHSLTLARSGIGRQAMTKAMALCCDIVRPDLVLHIGYCGGADPTLSIGDLVLASVVVDAATGEEIAPSPEYLARAEGLCKEADIRFKTGGLVTVDEVIPEPHEKAFIGTRYGALAVDMESSALAVGCRDRGIPFAVIRAVLDPLDMRLPNLAETVDEDGVTGPWRLVRHFLGRPRDLMMFPRIAYSASRAREALTSFVEQWINNRETEV